MKKYKETVQEINTWLEEFIETRDISKYTLKENSSTIFIDLSQQTIYQEYSGNKILNEQLFAYIEKAYSYTRKNANLQLRILFPEEMSLEERENIRQMMQFHYAIEFQEINKAIIRTNIKGTISLIVGAILFFIFGLLEWYKVNFIFQGIIEIFSWVFIWETVILMPLPIRQIALDVYSYLKFIVLVKKLNYKEEEAFSFFFWIFLKKKKPFFKNDL